MFMFMSLQGHLYRLNPHTGEAWMLSGLRWVKITELDKLEGQNG